MSRPPLEGSPRTGLAREMGLLGLTARGVSSNSAANGVSIANAASRCIWEQPAVTRAGDERFADIRPANTLVHIQQNSL